MQGKSRICGKAIGTILILTTLGVQSRATASTKNCLLTYENKTYINGNCKVTWSAEDKTIRFDDEREVIVCPDGTLWELGDCAGVQTRYYRRGVHGAIFLGGEKPILSWNMGKTRNNDYTPFIVKKQNGCWVTDQSYVNDSIFKGKIRLCY